MVHLLSNMTIVWCLTVIIISFSKVASWALPTGVLIEVILQISVLVALWKLENLENLEKMMLENCIIELLCCKMRKKKRWNELKKHVLRLSKCLNWKLFRKRMLARECLIEPKLLRKLVRWFPPRKSSSYKFEKKSKFHFWKRWVRPNSSRKKRSSSKRKCPKTREFTWSKLRRKGLNNKLWLKLVK